MPHIVNRHDRAIREADCAPETYATNLRSSRGRLNDRAARGAKSGRTSHGANARALLLYGLFAALLITDAAPVSAAGDCSPTGFRIARGFEAGTGNGRLGLLTQHLVAADFDGDGRLDLATADGLRHTIAVLLNDGGRFGAPARYGVGLGPAALAAADFNSDGRPDLAVVNWDGGSVSVLLGGAGGVFGAANHFAVGAQPESIVVDDFDGDGKADVAVTRKGGKVSVLLGDGAGAFTPGAGADYFVGQVAAAADFNSDGRRDLVVTGSAGVAVLAGDGAGGFPGGASFTYNVRASAAAAGDLNGDGKADLALGSFDGLVTLLGDGAGGFSAPSVVDDGVNGSVDVRAVADLDEDGKQDILATGAFVGVTLLFKGDGMGGFSRGKSHLSAHRQSAAVTGDFDGDGRRDIAAVGAISQSEGAVSVLLNKGGGDFQAALGVDTPGLPSDFALGDFNADGVADMVVLYRPQTLFRNPPPDPRVTFLLGDASGGFTPTFTRDSLAGLGSNVGVATADFNRDGKADVAVGLPRHPSGFVSINLSNGDGTFAAPHNVGIPFAASQTDPLLLTGDFNGDANPDVVAVYPDSRGLVALLGDGGGNFNTTAVQRAEISSFNVRAAVGDLNGDGIDDLVFADYNNRRVLTSLGKPTGLFEEARAAEVSGRPRAVAVGDFNRDGKRDVAVASHRALAGAPAEGSVSMLLGDGAGGFAAANVIYRGDGHPNYDAPDAVVAADFDGDGNTDLAVNLFLLVVVLSGNGDGTFGPAVLVEHFGALTPLSAHDFNADGRADLAVLTSNTIGVLFSEGPPLPCLFADDVTVVEGDEGTPTAQVTVRLSAASTQVVRVSYVTPSDEGFGATPEKDFTPSEGDLIFQPGETAKTINVLVRDDLLDEDGETFAVRLSSPLNARISDGFGYVRVVDDDPAPSISVSDVTVAEGNSPFNLVVARFTLTLSAPTGRLVSVNYVTSNGTAVAGSDYTHAQNTAVMFLNETTRTIDVVVRGDTNIEPDEDFFLNIYQPQNCVIVDGEAVGVITNDDDQVQFGAGALSVNEADGSVQVQVTRVGHLSRAAAVSYSTGGGTASGRSDYNRALGTLRFEPGEASKTINVFVTDDALVEDAETFDITLGDPVDCSLGSPSVASITLSSDDAAAGPNPADDTSFFVRQHYRDFLNREPDAAGLAFWTNEIESCGSDAQCREVRRVNVSAAFFLSIEFQQTGFLAYLARKAAFGDLAGRPAPITSDEMLQDAQVIGSDVVVKAEGWEQRLEQNKRAYFDRTAASQRFLAAYPQAVTPEQYVDALNANAAGALSQAERDALVGELKAGVKTRAQALRAVAEDPDLSAAETGKAFVLMQYFGYLRRDPDAAPDADYAGYAFWLSKLEQFGGDFIRAEMVKAFLSSDEYRKRFGQ